MNISYKEQLSQHVENIFKQYNVPGLHICDLATGGGKSYTIGKLTCEFYPEYFDKIVILCVQNKLVDGMNHDIEKFISSDKSLIKPTDKILIENNREVILKAVNDNHLNQLLGDMKSQVDSFDNQQSSNLKYKYSDVKKICDGLYSLCKTYNDSGKKNENDYILKQIEEAETNLRKKIKAFLETYKKVYLKANHKKRITLEKLLVLFPNLSKVYPQVEYKNKKVVLMTVHKAMYGLDPILEEKIFLSDFADNKKKTLILFDESDQAATAMRNVIIDQAIDKAGGQKRFGRGYNGYLQYKALIDSPEELSSEYHKELLDDAIAQAQKVTNSRWKAVLGDTQAYKNIFLDDLEELENFRRGVFFCGPTMKLNIRQSKDKPNSYICYKKGGRDFKLIHAKDDEQLKKIYSKVVPIDRFLSMILSNTTSIKSELGKVVRQTLKTSKQRFEAETNDTATNKSTVHHFLGYPTREREIHTLFSRFETTSEYQFEQQLNEFMINRKNVIIQGEDDNKKYPDYTVYTQGFQLYQEEVDELDNQHRVRLTCREITTTPEKILLDLLNSGTTSIVLCSATASCNSVISNFDIKYIQQSISDKVYSLSDNDRELFDELVEKTYPTDHRVEVVPISQLMIRDVMSSRCKLPDKYKKMFCQDAVNDGMVDKWFNFTLHKLRKEYSDKTNQISFELYKIFQFIEAYHWFIEHNDIHSMLFFQNRTGDKDKLQIHIISSLIDGSYKTMEGGLEDELPEKWENQHIRISKDWKDVEENILTRLSSDKEEKLMLVSAYGSFKAGANMQYSIPQGLKYLAGDNWEKEEGKLKKDWDAIFLQSPTAYLMMSDGISESDFEKSLYNVMLSLMMLHERGALSKSDVARWLLEALSRKFLFGDKNNLGIVLDKASWAQTIVEQAVGRLCRTRNKPQTTYILYDDSMSRYFRHANLEKSLTKEFKTLAEYINNHPVQDSENENPEEVILCNNANYAHNCLEQVRRLALRFTPKKSSDDDYEVEEGENVEIPFSVKVSQEMNQSYKQTIIRKPVISDFNELCNEDKRLTFISKCYGKWKRNENNEYFFSYDDKKRICPQGKGKAYPSPISPKSVRLDVFMKNDIIRAHFEKNGYATDWNDGDYILHPEILATDYAGEIGEEAFKALVLSYTRCTEDSFTHLEGIDYELADFIICDENGKYRIAFDVKNMRPESEHRDKSNDMSTTEKRRKKLERLGCSLITVNMLQLSSPTIDATREIDGLLDNEGRVIQEKIDQLIKLIDIK